MTDSLPDAVLSHDMWLLQLNIEAAVRSSKERDPARSAFYANTCAATWAAHRALRLLVELDPERAAAFVDELEEELGDGEYMETASERAEQAGVDVDGFADEIRTSIAADLAKATAEPERPSPEHSAIYMDGDRAVWSEYKTVPESDAVLPLVWAAERVSSRADLADEGVELRVVGWIK